MTGYHATDGCSAPGKRWTKTGLRIKEEKDAGCAENLRGDGEADICDVSGPSHAKAHHYCAEEAYCK